MAGGRANEEKNVPEHCRMHLREHSSIYLFVIVLFLMGVIFGAVVVNSLSFTQKEDLFYYLSQFFGQVSKEKWQPRMIYLCKVFSIIANLLG